MLNLVCLQYMRCFDNHTVITFEELSQSGQSVPIKKNPNCPRHPTESFKYYCNSCQASRIVVILHFVTMFLIEILFILTDGHVQSVLEYFSCSVRSQNRTVS